LPRT